MGDAITFILGAVLGLLVCVVCAMQILAAYYEKYLPKDG
jgi:hypothetical protein